MARRSAPGNAEGLRLRALDLLNNFEEELRSGNLRTKVQGLVPVFHAIRDLGSSLLPDHANAMDRILAYLNTYPMLIIPGDELMVVSGINEWARRVRQLRVEQGWAILSGEAVKDMREDASHEGESLSLFGADGSDLSTMKVTDYILTSIERDREAADRWHQANSIRKLDMSVQDKIIKFLLQNVGRPVTGEELRYLARDNSEWARRVRELRTEEGWKITTKTTGNPDLPVGTYLLESDKQAEAHDRHIKDDVRVAVLKRDKYTCQYDACGWSRTAWTADDPRHLELHHKQRHADGGANSVENLITYCNIHHDTVHREEGKARRA
jgi:hypothetical protein